MPFERQSQRKDEELPALSRFRRNDGDLETKRMFMVRADIYRCATTCRGNCASSPSYDLSTRWCCVNSDAPGTGRCRMLGRTVAKTAPVVVVVATVLLTRWDALDAQQTCTVGVGDGTPPREVVINEMPAHCGFLQFSWQAFMAMNWPALPISPGDTTQRARGLPDRTRQIGQDDSDETVWEQFQPNWYLFAPNNPPPASVNGDSWAAWNQHAALPAACGPKNLPPGTKSSRHSRSSSPCRASFRQSAAL